MPADETTTAPTERPRFSLFRGKLPFWLVIPPLVALDLWSKQWVFAFLSEAAPSRVPEARSYHVFDWGWLDFDLVSWTNRGTIWGLGQAFTDGLIVLRCVVVLGILWFALRPTQRHGRTMLVVLGVILAGAIGNLYDNFFTQNGAVRDFLRFTGDWWGWRWEWPAFNVADSCICVGAITFAVLMWVADARGRSRIAHAAGRQPSA